jgi:hypothetical protein
MSITPGTGVSPEDIASVQAAQRDMMPEIVTMLERVDSRDNRGGTISSYVERPEKTIGRVGKVKDTTRVAFAGQLRGKATAMLTVPVDCPIQELWRVQVLNGLYNVVADLSRSSYATSGRFLIEEV